jgi:hypothetical protein
VAFAMQAYCALASLKLRLLAQASCVIFSYTMTTWG